jgi:hypothetical protein
MEQPKCRLRKYGAFSRAEFFQACRNLLIVADASRGENAQRTRRLCSDATRSIAEFFGRVHFRRTLHRRAIMRKPSVIVGGIVLSDTARNVGDSSSRAHGVPLQHPGRHITRGNTMTLQMDDPVRSVPVSHLDPYCDEVLLDPWPTYRELQSLGPAVWLSKYRMFALTRFESVSRSLKDTSAFSSASGRSGFGRQGPRRVTPGCGDRPRASAR